MRVDLAMAGAAGWYRVLNACRTLYYVDQGAMCGKLIGAAWARTRVADPSLIDAAIEWRRHGLGPALIPDEVDAFVNAIAGRLNGGTPADGQPATEPAVDTGAHVAEADDGPLVTCVLVTPVSEDLLVLAARRFVEQDWRARELLVLRPPGTAPESAMPRDERIRTVGIASEETGLWRELALHQARGGVIAAWDPGTWYSADRLTQQVRELLSTSTPRVVAPSLLVYDPARRDARRLREAELLERTTLCARRPAWNAAGAPARLGERSDIAVAVGRAPPDAASPPPRSTRASSWGRSWTCMRWPSRARPRARLASPPCPA
jgi:hypothetical protein